MPSAPQALCSVCHQAAFRYTCPRCEALYCSLACYQQHGMRCVENFYQAQVEGELRSMRADGEERRRLEKILSKLNALDDASESEEEEGLDGGIADGNEADGLEEDRLLALLAKAEGGELSVEDLRPEELQRFHSELKRGALARSVPLWAPWWERAAVVELDELDELPEAPSELAAPPHLCCAAEAGGAGGGRANPAVSLTVFEVVYAYVHVMRAFNGDCTWDQLQAALHFLHLAPSVCAHRVHRRVEDCFLASLASAAALPGGFGAPLDERCLEDTVALLRGGGMLASRAVRETAALVAGAAEVAKARGDKANARLARGAKKLEFLLSFAYHHEDALFAPLEAAARFCEARRQERQAAREAEQRRRSGGVALPPRLGEEATEARARRPTGCSYEPTS